MITNEMINNYTDLTENNAHGLVLEEIATDFQLSKHASVFQSINNIHALEGHLSYDVLQIRDRFKGEMFEILENILTIEEYEEIRSLV